ncbi:ATP phosphoribosyltransferase regulatory subunit [Anaerosporobacter faecicola]|uniref:ATP phosphoribosyltransferase regulatory subunit n=1 Tax=Anaerosporobacter faecicola TaxID=2718714 RepID=UPI00143B4A01|nr:ATP phosphoribosyltransferase regulatory subunit [Anaerosporobacter faecicola]
MIDKLLHTPEGVRDIYNGECEKKLILQERMHEILKLYGFKDIQTPTFEFFDIFNKERGTIASKEMYKFFDREGNTLALRPDMTPAIARCVAKYYREENLPIRLCYMGSTFINNSSYQGKLKETTQLGAELVNDSSVDADAQMIALSIECLKKVGLKEFQLEVGHVDFFRGLVEEACFEEDEIEQLRAAIEDKNLFGVEELVSNKNIDNNLKEVLFKLPELFGNEEILNYAKKMTSNQKAQKAIERLKEVYEILNLYGLGDYVTFDLGMLSKYNYYTGVIFRGFTYGTGDAIVTGGRYDKLVCQFGKDSAAIGVAIVVDQLMNALSRQKIEIELAENNTLILYKEEFRKSAITLAGYFRKNGMNIEMLCVKPGYTVEDYKEYASRIGIGGILMMENQETIQVINRKENVTNVVKMSDLIQ